MRALEILEEEVRARVYEDPYREGRRIEDARRAWGGVYLRTHGGGAEAYRRPSLEVYERVAAELAQPGLDAVDRALLVEVFGTMERRPDEPRELALEVYRPYLRAETIEEQRAAVSVAASIWDSGVVEDLRHLGYESEDTFTRLRAFNLVSRFLRYGSAYPPAGKDVASRDWAEAHREAFDPAGLREWKSGYDAWYREWHILATGEPPAPPPPPMPAPPSIDLRGEAATAQEAGASPEATVATERPASPLPLPASSTTERRPVRAADPSQELPVRPTR
jgi:hypothetical protein